MEREKCLMFLKLNLVMMRYRDWETNVRVSVNEALFTDRIFMCVYFDEHTDSYAMARKMYLLPVILIFVEVF